MVILGRKKKKRCISKIDDVTEIINNTEQLAFFLVTAYLIIQAGKQIHD